MSRLILCGVAASVALIALLIGNPGINRGALAHSDAAWIMQSPETRWCCSERDCSALHNVLSTKDGWTFINPITGAPTTVPYNFANRYPSIDEHFWVCLYPHGGVRCFFSAPDGV